jgi:NAD(P)-dependent dehydrogenase (short-subunit alcohol dehydrogenase family)
LKNKVWFITGASRGLGRVWAEAALLRGDKVAATARKLEDVADLAERFGELVLPLALDVTDAGQVKRVVDEAHAHFGRLDIVLNNAGYPLLSTVEEASEEAVRALFDTNYFGMLRVIQAALPLLRKQGSGHIIGISSTMGIITMPLIGFYATTKWAMEAMHESLAMEVKPFGIKVTIVEPGAYATEFGKSAKQAEAMEVYAPLRKHIFERLATQERGNPNATGEAMLKLVAAEEPPLRMMLGNKNLPAAKAAYAERLAVWEAWEAVSNAAQG